MVNQVLVSSHSQFIETLTVFFLDNHRLFKVWQLFFVKLNCNTITDYRFRIKSRRMQDDWTTFGTFYNVDCQSKLFAGWKEFFSHCWVSTKRGCFIKTCDISRCECIVNQYHVLDSFHKLNARQSCLCFFCKFCYTVRTNSTRIY
ncbi:Uncharacterised protein [Chlamydia trachomatis]|nr:Uncharacterised protein [Chlamydia trachomatis]